MNFQSLNDFWDRLCDIEVMNSRILLTLNNLYIEYFEHCDKCLDLHFTNHDDAWFK